MKDFRLHQHRRRLPMPLAAHRHHFPEVNIQYIPVKKHNRIQRPPLNRSRHAAMRCQMAQPAFPLCRAQFDRMFFIPVKRQKTPDPCAQQACSVR
jgi:hypothetical protein